MNAVNHRPGWEVRPVPFCPLDFSKTGLLKSFLTLIVMSETKKTGNDQKADVNNPNNEQHQKAIDNRANQLNPNHDASKSK